MRRERQFILFDLAEEAYSQRAWLLLAGLYLGTISFAALVSPLVYRLVQYFAESLQYLAARPFPEYFERARLLGLLLIVPWLFKACGLWPWSKIGLGRERALRRVAIPLLAGVVMILLTLLIQAALGNLAFRESVEAGRLLRGFGGGLVAGTLVALVEEIVFRGLVLRLFYTALRPLPAVVGSAALFALMHFKMPDDAMAAIPPGEIGPGAGARAIYETIVAPFAGFDATLWLNLLLVGVLLNIAFLATSSLWVPIGLHAGWVATLAASGALVLEDGGGAWFAGWSLTVELGAIALLAFVWWRRRSP